ncbi:triose-phosphate isomerase [Thalassolituus sp. ST750PaO-4]|uniref:triose-phosphate isomerase n=1 Tax=Thalassolituus sp. ST750PaO-4 TaxID=2742965 RepID=UPI001CE2BE42|nr:triose-phosphate isomerase [Thalassolituus sp. ST750PaO-4]MCA6061710.1 triose-phosphate isomerase [Thalassolituus sp. ST750PaO-4]
MRRLLVAGNWKMNASVAMTQSLLSELRAAQIDQCDVAVFPPFPYLTQASELLSGSDIALGAQNCAAEESGAFTGEVSAPMLADVGCAMALIGHSERRTLYGETDDTVLAKTRQLLDNSMTAVVCVGETLAERQAGQAEAVVAQQLKLLLEQLNTAQWQRIILAYEPVWAIGTGETATPEQAQAIHAFIRSQLQVLGADVAQATRILYGGSVKAANAAELFSQPDIDGGLVGGASLDATEFLGICRA